MCCCFFGFNILFFFFSDTKFVVFVSYYLKNSNVSNETDGQLFFLKHLWNKTTFSSYCKLWPLFVDVKLYLIYKEYIISLWEKQTKKNFPKNILKSHLYQTLHFLKLSQKAEKIGGSPQLPNKTLSISWQIRGIHWNEVVRCFALLSLPSSQQKNL